MVPSSSSAKVGPNRSTFSRHNGCVHPLYHPLGWNRLGCTPPGPGFAFLPSNPDTHAEPAPPHIVGGLTPKAMEHAQLLEESFPTCFSRAIRLTWPAFRRTLAPCADPRSFRCGQNTGLSRDSCPHKCGGSATLCDGAGNARLRSVEPALRPSTQGIDCLQAARPRMALDLLTFICGKKMANHSVQSLRPGRSSASTGPSSRPRMATDPRK